MSEEQTLSLLNALCSGLSPNGIEVVADEWRTAFVPRRKRIMVARRFLTADTPVAIGALLHEVGHTLVTRYHLFAEPSDASRALWREALNAVEETRVHRFLRRRLPGAGGYLDALFAMDDAPEPADFESDLMVFLAATAVWDRHPSLPFLAGFPAAAAAFHRTEPARAAYARALPPPDLAALPNIDARYERDVTPLVEADDQESIVPLEAEVRCAAVIALRVFRASIWPEIVSLARRDQARIAHSVAYDPDLRAAAEHSDAGVAVARRALRAWIHANGTEAVPEAAENGDIRKLAESLLRRYLEGRSPHQPHGRMPGPTRSKVRVAELSDDIDLSPDRDSGEIERPTVQPLDDETHRARSTLVDVLRRAVPRRPIRRISGYRSGTGIDVDRAMRAAAAGRDGDRIWVRRAAERSALAALLLVDLSGSMSGQKVEAAIAATRALSAALAEVRGVTWSVHGFQDITIPFVRFDEHVEPHVLARIEDMRAEVAGNRHGGNNQPRYNDDGPCLLEAAAALQARPERDRLLMVISDGNPEGRRSSREDLHRAVAQVQAMPGIALVGLGLGPSTDHVTRYYPVSQANIALGDLAKAIGALLASGLRRAAH